jgi:hypothetical protein
MKKLMLLIVSAIILGCTPVPGSKCSYEIYVPQYITYYTSNYTLKDGCVKFFNYDRPDDERIICGAFVIERRK